MITASERRYPVKVSVVLPTFNQSKYLLGAIQSVLNQTNQDFEFIIVNDGSTDETAQLLARINHPKIHVITQSNQGLPAALNAGFAVARGEYWTWTSTDNIVSANWLEELVNALDQAPAEIGYAFSFYAVMDENEKILYVNRDQRFDLPTLLMRHRGNASFLYRSDLAKKVGLYDVSLAYAEDLDMWVRMAEVTRAVHVESVLYYYRQHSHSMTTQQDRVREATKGVVNKYLAKTSGRFEIDRIFPNINLSADPILERWKSRMWLVTLGACATFYCPVDALVDQLILALKEHYERGLVGNIVHFFAKEDRWDAAAQTVALYYQKDPSDFFKQLADIIVKKDRDALQRIPFLTLEQKYLAVDCQGDLSQQALIRNTIYLDQKPFAFEEIIKDWLKQMEDHKDHPEIWRSIASLQSPEEKQLLNHLKNYLSELLNLPQDPTVLILLQILEAICFAYTGHAEAAKDRLKLLNRQNPNIPVLMGALLYICQDEITSSASLASIV